MVSCARTKATLGWMCLAVLHFLLPRTSQAFSLYARNTHHSRMDAILERPDFTTLAPGSMLRRQNKSTRLLLSPYSPIDCTSENKEPTVPTTLREAFRIFFLHGYNGPRLIVGILLGTLFYRYNLAPLTLWDGAVAIGTIAFWWVQEHFLHSALLHSSWDWYGKQIHQDHHEKPYFHISIDPAGLMLAWFAVAHILMRLLFPLPLALSATFAYACAGLFYEYVHFIVHTRVRSSPNSYWAKVKTHHARHHLINNKYWFGFSLPVIDTWMGTDPPYPEGNLMGKHESSAY